jgi:hypothetical protein
VKDHPHLVLIHLDEIFKMRSSGDSVKHELENSDQPYLLRLCKGHQAEGIGIRASLENMKTVEFHGFEILSSRVIFLGTMEKDTRKEENGSSTKIKKWDPKLTCLSIEA